MQLPTLPKQVSLYRAAVFAVLLLASVLGNVFCIPLFPGYDYLFGSIFVLTIVCVHGVGWGLIAAIASTFPAVVHAAHPYPLVVFSGEVIAVAVWLRRTESRSLVLSEVVYWLFVGAPLVSVVFVFILKLSPSLALVASFKLLLNGVTNAFVATWILRLLSRFLPQMRLPVRTQSAVFDLFNLAGIGLCFPTVFAVSLYGRAVESSVNADLQRDVSETLQHLSSGFNLLLADHFSWLHVIALSQKRPAQPAPYYSQAIGFELLLSVNPSGQPTVISARLGFFNGPFAYNELAASALEISRLGQQDAVIVVPTPGSPSTFRIALVSPIIEDGVPSGCVVGLLEPSRIMALADSVETRLSHSVSVLGRDGLVLASTTSDRFNGSIYDPAAGRSLMRLSSTLSRRVPPPELTSSSLEQWQKTWYIAEQEIPGTPALRALVEAPIRARQERVIFAYLVSLGFAVGGLSLALIAAYFAARRVTYPLRQLLRSVSLLEQGSAPMTFPSFNVEEVDRLSDVLHKILETTRRDRLALDSELERVRSLQGRGSTKGTAELSHSLSQTTKTVAPSNQPLRRFAGTIAHDFNNIFGALLGFGDMLSDDLEGHPSLPMVAQLMDSARGGAHISHLLLGFSGRCLLQAAPVSVADLVTECLHTVRSRASRHVQFDVAPIDERVAVFGDPSELSLALGLVLNNALEAMPNGGVLSVRATENLTDASSTVTLRIRDSGTGMPAQVLAHVFDPYYSTKPKGRGRGLSLSFIQGIIEQHAGSVLLTSELGAGTTVEITLPLHVPSSDDLGPCDVPVAELPEHPTVLVVDDEPNIRGIIGDVLSKEGFRVLTAGSMQEALACARNEDGDIHLLVADVVLPDKSGFDVYDALVLSRPSLRVLYISGYAGESLIQELQFSKRKFLQKPFDRYKLLDAVHYVLGASAADR